MVGGGSDVASRPGSSGRRLSTVGVRVWDQEAPDTPDTPDGLSGRLSPEVAPNPEANLY